MGVEEGCIWVSMPQRYGVATAAKLSKPKAQLRLLSNYETILANSLILQKVSFVLFGSMYNDDEEMKHTCISSH